ncbi:DUF4175 family protein [bacterium]|nr:DUF4175 family protein [bacterium]
MPVTASSRHKVELALERELLRLRRRLRLRALAWGFFSAVVVAGVGGAALALAHPLVASHLALSGTAALAFLALVGWGLARLALAPLWEPLPADRLLSAVEHRNPELYERLSTALYLYRSDEVDKYRFSPELVRATLSFAEARAELGELRQGFSWRPVLYPLAWCTMVVALWGGLYMLRDRWVLPAWTGYRSALVGHFPAEPPLRFTTSGDLYVRPGQATEIGARVLGDAPGKMLLELIGPDETRRLVEGEARGATTYFQIPPIAADHSYRVFAGGHFSREHRLTLLVPPRIVRWRWTITPPGYTGLAVERVVTPSRRISAPVGSWGELSAECNWPLARVATRGGLLNVSVDAGHPRELVGAMEFASAAAVVVRLEDVFGQIADETLEVSLVPDHPPEVALSFPPRLWHPPDKTTSARLEWAATDDYGVDSATLVFRINASEANEDRVGLYGPGVVAGTVEATTNGFIGGYLWDLAPLRLLPGDEVNYWVEASDRRPAPGGPNLGRSGVHTLRIPSLLEQYSDQFESQAAQLESMEDLLERQRALAERVKQIRRNLEEKQRNIMLGKERPESAWEEEKALEEALRDQEALERQMERLREAAQESLSVGEEERRRATRTEEKRKKINELLEQILDEKAKALRNRMREAIEEMARQMDARQLETLEIDMEEYEQQLDRLLDQLQNLYTERQVEQMLERAQELAEAQREISERTEDARDLGEEAQSKEELARQEEFLAQELEELAQQLERLAERNAESNPERSEMLQKAADELRQSGVTEDVEKAMEELRQEQFSQSLQSQRQAQGKMDQLASRMQQMQEAMGGPDMQMDIEKIGAVARRALYLSHRHEATVVAPLFDLSRTSRWSEAGQQRISRELDSYRAETARLVALLDEAMREVPFVDDRAGRALAGALRTFRQSVRAAEDEQPASALPAANQALRFLNETVRALLDSLSQMQSMQQMMQPGGQEATQQMLEQLAQRQRSLGQRLQRLQAAPRDKPGWQEMMDRMAEEQKAIREELEGLSEQLEKSKEQLGEAGEAAEDMKEAEELLRQHHPDDPRLKEKQEQILEKLLQGGKSLKRDEFEKERQSEVAKKYPRPEVLDRAGPGRDLQRTLLRRAEGLEDENLSPRLRAPASNYFRNLAEEL